ncbi:MAG: pseudouridine synthase [Clostridia bacterium]|nr:pseudouridine synthase [Clostridia bacterium]
MRLDKLVADMCGVARAEAKTIIKAGRISCGGKKITDFSQNVSEKSEFEFDGNPVVYERCVYIMMNKPAGVVCATEDSKHQTVLDLLGERYKRRRLFPVGRLDIDTTGLLILTNDGPTAHYALSPKRGHEKTYIVNARSPLSETDRKLLENGVDIGGLITRPATVLRLRETEFSVTITEGKFHQIKKMFEKVGNRVEALKRVSFCGITLDDELSEGQFRPLNKQEISCLTQTIQ